MKYFKQVLDFFSKKLLIFFYLVLKTARKSYLLFLPLKRIKFQIDLNEAEKANKLISDKLNSISPCMIARFGATELNVINNHIGINSKEKSILKFITNKCPQWWWNKNILRNFNIWSGFFPINNLNLINKYCDLFFKDIKEIDILGVWGNSLNFHHKNISNVNRVKVEYLEPFFSKNPWTKALEGKKVLVIHPFKDSIEQQYKKKNLLFSNNLLPNFELITLKAVQSVANETTHYKDWFEALEYMKNEMNKVNFDIALIGCGAYGLHLAAHAKKIGKKGFHIGGVLQIIFGIIGTRYENPNQSGGVYLKLFNKNWIRPSKDETPKDAHLVEKNTYW